MRRGESSSRRAQSENSEVRQRDEANAMKRDEAARRGSEASRRNEAWRKRGTALIALIIAQFSPPWSLHKTLHYSLPVSVGLNKI